MHNYSLTILHRFKQQLTVSSKLKKLYFSCSVLQYIALLIFITTLYNAGSANNGIRKSVMYNMQHAKRQQFQKKIKFLKIFVYKYSNYHLIPSLKHNQCIRYISHFVKVFYCFFFLSKNSQVQINDLRYSMCSAEVSGYDTLHLRNT